MTRRKRTTLQRAKIFDDHKGKCHICEEKIDGTREAWELEHVIPYEMTRDDTDENLAPAHVSCHRGKTRADKADIAKAKRVSAKHNGARMSKNPLPGGKNDRRKKKIDGTVVPR
ncbi:HNH endonuclease signature motif containing protein [Aliisedimentitalea scapharcae]|uniref:HNH endonuclease signature motif containing protein n=1 Tax=Aliisedimentitalea scapharcae TaxID=1524259 RepID=A0ABZ2XSI0_9RHOB